MTVTSGLARRQNIVVTCGTSQIEDKRRSALEVVPRSQKVETCNNLLNQDKYGFFGVDSPQAFVEAVLRQNTHVPQLAGTIALIQDLETKLGEKLKRVIQPGASAQGALPGPFNAQALEKMLTTAKNPFGAELSTLFLMESRKRFIPKADRVTVVSSDTPGGLFSACLLCRILQVYRGLGAIEPFLGDDRRVKLLGSNSRLRVMYVRGLQGEAGNLGDVDTDVELRQCLEDAMEPNRSEYDQSLVYTGGYKGTIPTLVEFALEHACATYYKHERSRRVKEKSYPQALAEAFRSAKRESPIKSGTTDDDEGPFGVRTGQH
jgi:hypothetical protein